MSRRPSFSWNAILPGEGITAEQKLRSISKKHNDKVYREKKKLREENKSVATANLPPTVKIRQAKLDIGNWKDYDKAIKKADSFIRYGASYAMTDKQKERVDKTVKNFNAKRERLLTAARKKVENGKMTHNQFSAYEASLPRELTRRDLVSGAYSTKGLNENIRRFKRFSKRGAEKLVDVPGNYNNLKVTNWQYTEMLEMAAIANDRRAEERLLWQQADLKYGGKAAGYNRDAVGMDKGDYGFAPLEAFTMSSTAYTSHRKFHALMREAQGEHWDRRTAIAKENYLKELRRVLRDDTVGRELYDYINSLPLSEFKRTLISEMEPFMDLYEVEVSRKEAEYTSAVEKVWNTWMGEKEFPGAEYHELTAEELAELEAEKEKDKTRKAKARKKKKKEVKSNEMDCRL